MTLNPAESGGRAETVHLAAAVRSYAQSGGNPYIVQMWDYALNVMPIVNRGVGSGCDAIPYLPINPEDYGLCLGPESRILDIGCLGGYGLYDITRKCVADGRSVPRLTGVDVSDDSIRLARVLSAFWSKSEVDFHVLPVEKLNSALGMFDLIVCRLVLPYTDVKAALHSIRCSMIDKGLVVLQVHAPLYYCKQALSSFPDFKRGFYYTRPLMSFFLFWSIGYQLPFTLFKETAMTRGLLERLCKRAGFRLLARFGSSERPTYVYKAI